MTARRNLIERADETFRPPPHRPGRTARDRLANRLRRFLDLQAGSIWRDLVPELARARGRLIDIGCGSQMFRELIPAGTAYLGIDTADARDRFGYGLPDTHYFTGDDWGVPHAAFDVALCTEVLEHIEDPAAFLARTFACLTPGGRLVLTVPFAARWHFIPYDYWRYTPSGLVRLLRAAGFAEVRVTARGNPLTVACYKVMALPLALLVGRGAARRALGALLLPVVAGVALLANLTMAGDWGDDCLGYTVTARRPAAG